MYGFKECLSCRALYNRKHCCSNVSFVDNFVRDPNPISYDETSDSSQQHPRNCSKCGGPFSGLYCRQCTYERCIRNYTDEVCALCCYEIEKSFVNDSNPNSFIDSPNNFNPPPQPQTDDDSFENIDYVEASPPNSELISLEEVKDDILRKKLLNINLLIAKIKSLNDNPTLDCVLKSPSPFPIPIEPDQGELTSVVMEDILGEPRVHVPNVLPTHPTLMLDSDFIPSDDSLGSDLEVSFPYGTRNKIFDPGIFFEVQSKRFLSRDTFSISFIRNPLCPVIETLLPFSSKNEDKVFNPGILPSNLLSHRGKITSDFSESPMMISGGDIPFLDVLFLHFYPH
ncbi:hypothetical protein Tco_1393288 [Tanacetum coccineum]